MKNFKLIIGLVAALCVFQAVAMERSQVGPKPDVLNSKLTKHEQKALREAIMGMRPLLLKQHNGEILSKKEQAQLDKQAAVVNKFVEYHSDDSFVAEKMKNHWTFLRKLDKEKAANTARLLAESKIVSTECCICMDDESTMLIPCKGNHPERICESCLDMIAAKTSDDYPNGKCPICNGQLEAKK